MNLQLLKADSRASYSDYSQLQKNSEEQQDNPIDAYVPNIVQFGNLKTTTNSNAEKVITDTISKVNKTIADTGTTLEMTIYRPTHEIQVKIKDKSGKVIREIPSEKMLELGVYMRRLSGIIVDTSV
jgi:uncharacterized FlaG/YvyC family protein